jgi:transposase-like protein
MLILLLLWACGQRTSAVHQIHSLKAGKAMDLTKARLAWVELYAKTGDAGLVCRRCGISGPTLHKWWRRYQAEGKAGLLDHMLEFCFGTDPIQAARLRPEEKALPQKEATRPGCSAGTMVVQQIRRVTTRLQQRRIEPAFVMAWSALAPRIKPSRKSHIANEGCNVMLIVEVRIGTSRTVALW